MCNIVLIYIYISKTYSFYIYISFYKIVKYMIYLYLSSYPSICLWIRDDETWTTGTTGTVTWNSSGLVLYIYTVMDFNTYKWEYIYIYIISLVIGGMIPFITFKTVKGNNCRTVLRPNTLLVSSGSHS